MVDSGKFVAQRSAHLVLIVEPKRRSKNTASHYSQVAYAHVLKQRIKTSAMASEREKMFRLRPGQHPQAYVSAE